MILADKIIRLRKKMGWSQEEFAEKMKVSRQAVSKWEAAQTVPDLQRVLQMADIFGVTTDYLLKDEIENAEFVDSESDNLIRRVSMEEANNFLAIKDVTAKRTAIGVFLIMIAVAQLVFFAALSETGMNENVASGIGVVALILLVAVAVAIFISCGFMLKPYEFLDKGEFELEYGVRGMVKEEQKAYHDTYAKSNIIGTVLCIISPIPLIITGLMDNETAATFALPFLLIMVGIAVYMFVFVGTKWGAMDRLLREGDFAKSKRREKRITDIFSPAYWLIVTAIFIAVSLPNNAWGKTYIIWPVAAILYAAALSVIRNYIAKKEIEDK